MAQDSKFDEPHTKQSVTRIVEMKIPLTWLLGSALAIVVSYVTLMTDMKRFSTDFQEMKTAVNAQVTTTSTLQSQQTIMQFRMDNLEAEIRRIQQIDVRKK